MKKVTNRLTAAFWSAPVVFCLATALAGSAALAQPAPVEEFRPGFLAGYLHQQSLPNALVLIPPAPAQHSTAFAWEQDVNQKIQALRGGARWDLATLDNDLTLTNAAGTEETLRNDGSYPTGHTAIGWAWALILSEIAPDRANELQARGLAFGDSRLVCNVHWPMDDAQGLTVGAATIAVLQSDALFRSDLANAKAEVAAIRARGLPTHTGSRC